MELFTIALPGAFMRYMTGTAVYEQAEAIHGYGPAGERLAGALHAAEPRRAGKGERYLIPIDAEALAVLRDYADTCNVVNQDDGDPAEARAARAVMERIDALTVTEAEVSGKPLPCGHRTVRKAIDGTWHCAEC